MYFPLSAALALAYNILSKILFVYRIYKYTYFVSIKPVMTRWPKLYNHYQYRDIYNLPEYVLARHTFWYTVGWIIYMKL